MENLKMTDMALDEEDRKDQMPAVLSPGEGPKYPWGLSIRLTQHQIEKLNLDYSDWKIGDMFHLHALAKVTSISEHENENSQDCCIELQITHLAGESEDQENEEAEEEMESEEFHEDEQKKEPKKRPNNYF